MYIQLSPQNTNKPGKNIVIRSTGNNQSFLRKETTQPPQTQRNLDAKIFFITSTYLLLLFGSILFSVFSSQLFFLFSFKKSFKKNVSKHFFLLCYFAAYFK